MVPKIESLIQDLAADNTSGASQLAVKTGDILRLIFSEASPTEHIILSLIRAQPAMAPLINLINDSLVEFENSGKTAADRFIDAFLHNMSHAGNEAAQNAAGLLGNAGIVLTISHSSTVWETLKILKSMNNNLSVIVSESRPAYEGLILAKRLADFDIPVTLTSDAALFQQVGEADAVLVGADALMSKGLVNKTGTSALAFAAKAFQKPFHVVTTLYKFLPPPLEHHFRIPNRDPREITSIDLPPSVKVINRYFDVTPWHLVISILTEQGETTINDLLSSDYQRKIASQL